MEAQETCKSLLSSLSRAYLTALLGADISAWSPEKLKAALDAHARQRLSNSRHLAVVDLAEGDSILDIGCDIGVIAHTISRQAEHVVAYDIRPEAIEVATMAFSGSNISYRVGDPLNSALATSSFDCVIFLETIEHIDAPMASLREIHRILRPNGVLVLSSPNALSYREFLRQLLRLWPSFRSDRGIHRLIRKVASEKRGSGTQDDHLYSWTWETLARLVCRSGFAYETHRRVGFGVPSISLGSHRLWPLGRGDKMWLRPFVGPFCQNFLLKVRAVK
jgi:SAM-dependent methyltransferase